MMPTITLDDIALMEEWKHDINGEVLVPHNLLMMLCAAARRGVESDKDLDAMYAERCRLAREIDVAMHGEEGAAKQASLCDLVPSARWLRARAERAEAALAAAVAREREALRKLDELTPCWVRARADQPEYPSTADDEATRWRHGEKI